MTLVKLIYTCGLNFIHTILESYDTQYFPIHLLGIPARGGVATVFLLSGGGDLGDGARILGELIRFFIRGGLNFEGGPNTS